MSFCIAVSAGIQHQSAYRIGRVLAVSDEVFKALITRRCLVLAKSLEQICKRIPGYVASFYGLGQRHKYRVTSAAEIAGIKFRFPFVEQLQRKLRISDLIAQIVRDPAVGVDTVEVRLQAPREKPGSNGEVLVMRACQPLAVSEGLRQ